MSEAKTVSTTRKSCNAEEHTILVAQVNQRCPLCETNLFMKKKNGTHKHYQIAHIYPHSLTKKDEKTLASIDPPLDTESLSNLIPLCPNCHIKYDTGKTLEEYHSLRNLKDNHLENEAQLALQFEYKLKEDINIVVTALDSLCITTDELIPLNYEPKKVTDKLKTEKSDQAISALIIKKIKESVIQYYNFVDKCFKQIQKEKESAEIIALQIKLYYLEQKKLKVTKQKIYYNMVDWVLNKTKTENREAAGIIVSYFIQHCEVFE